jgi:Ser/Thr protein kinase RdoA (MazF antagonist)/4-aminobutyrate aminotransferase-like enzyme
MADAATDTPEIAESAPARETDSPLDRVDELLREHWGLSGQVFPVEQARGIAYLIDNGHLRYLLDIRAPQEEAALTLEHEVMRHIIRSPDGPPVCEPVATRDGEETLAAIIGGEDKVLRLLTVLEGSAAAPTGELSAATGASLGALAASLTKSLIDFDQKEWNGEHQDDLRKAGPRTVSLLSEVTDQQARDFIARAMVAALRRIHPLTPDFRLGLTVPDLGLDSLVGEERDGEWMATGITDLAGLARSWQVAALAKTCARILFSRAGEPASVLSAVSAYHAIDPLNASEIEALWPLTMGELALIAAVAENRLAQNTEDTEAARAAAQTRDVLATASTVTAAYMHAAVQVACNIEPAALEIGPLVPDIDPDRIRLVDLGVTSPLFQDGNWTDADCDWKLLARIAWETGMGSTRYGEYRLSRSALSTTDMAAGGTEPENVALHVDVCLPAGTLLTAPFAGLVTGTSPRLSIRGQDVTLLLEGIATDLVEGTEVDREAVIGKVGGEEGSVGGIRLRFSRDPDNLPPLFCKPSEAGIWRHLAPSPAAALGLDCDAPQVTAGRIGRGWREFLYDEAGRILLDFDGSAPLIGHGHPAVATASYRQSLLIAASHGDLAVSDALKEALSEITPPGLGSIVLFADRASALAALEKLGAAGEQPQEVGEDALPAQSDTPNDDEAITEPENTERTGLVVIEPLPGSSGLGERIAELKNQGSLVVGDETRTGYGRLGDTVWAIEQAELTVDALLVGSCDGGALTAICCGDDLAARVAHLASPACPVAAATALAALNVLRADGLQANAKAMGEILEQGLRQLAEESDGSIAINGQGLYWEIQPREESLDFGPGFGRAVLHALGDVGQRLLLPPLCVEKTSIGACLGHLRQALGLLAKTEI